MSKILICHPDETTRESLKLILSDHTEMILTDTISQSIDCLKNAKDIGVLLLNVDASKEFSPLNVKHIIKDHPKLKVISITEHKVKTKGADAIHNGASGNIIKPFKSDEILSMIKKTSSK
jgi:DNA-binding NtrC family response regulator